MDRRALSAGVLMLSLALGGCSALKLSTSDGDAAPVKIGVGEGSSAAPTSTGSSIPEGMSTVSVNLGAECPVAVELAMDPEWNDETAFDGYQLFTRDDDAIITVNCNESRDDTAQEIVDKARKYTFAEPGSTNQAEHMGTLSGGTYWTFHGTLAPTEMRAIEHSETVIYGAVVGIKDNGRLYKATVEMSTKSGDEATADRYEQMLPTVHIADQELEPPAFS